MVGPLRSTRAPGAEYEERLARAGCKAVAGIDEVGRGPLAGPVLAAAVVMPERIPGEWFGRICDSKQMSFQKRAVAFEELREGVKAVGVGSCSPGEIDSMGIVPATRLAMMRALEVLEVRPDHLLIDALGLPGVDIPQTSIVKGDAISISIAAASIVAKVTRDGLMSGVFDTRYPGYGFASNKGYGTAMHRAALRRLGPTPIHRRSFAPVRRVLGHGLE